MNKIFITGCPKSGTTLMCRMFNAFHRTYVIREEVSLLDFANLKPEAVGDFDFVVAKRSWDTILSTDRLPADQIALQEKIANDAGISIVNMIRDGRDVIASYLEDWGLNGCFEWMSCMLQDRGIANLEVKYEDLVMKPDKVQSDISKVLGMDYIASFSDYPAFIPDALTLPDPKLARNYRYRPITDESIGKRPGLHRSIRPNDVNYFEKILKDNGYPS